METTPPRQPDAVLVVGGDGAGRSALAQTLRGAGFAVREASGGRDALRLLAEPVDLVVLDAPLPDTDGFEVCRRVKAGAATAAVPVLMVFGAAARGGDRVRGLAAGADACLAGPVEPEELLAHARALLRVRRAEEALR